MTTIESLLKEMDQEAETTRKMLNQVPDENYDWKPHAKSMALYQLATHLAELPTWVSMALTTSQLDFAANPLRNGDTIYSVSSKAEVIRTAYCQIVHHRAQLGVYLRLLNIPIPGSYGPSADEMGL